MKLELYNQRLNFGTGQRSARIYDSLEHDISSSVLPITRKSNKSRLIQKQEKEKRNLSIFKRPRTTPNRSSKTDSRGSNNFPISYVKTSRNLPEKINGVRIHQSLTDPHDLHLNKTAFEFKKISKCNKVDTEIMSRMLDRVHDVPQLTISGALERGTIPGLAWTGAALERNSYIPTPVCRKGPGEYDSSKWYKYEKGKLLTPQLTKMSHAERVLDYNSMDSGSPPPTSYFPDIGFKVDASGTPKFTSGQDDRFKHLFNTPKYLSYTGLLLDPDYDRKQSWGKPDIPVKLGLKEPRHKDPQVTVFSIPILVPDAGVKESLKTSIEKSPIKYASSFSKNKGKVHFSTTSATTTDDTDESFGFLNPDFGNKMCFKTSVDTNPYRYAASFAKRWNE